MKERIEKIIQHWFLMEPPLFQVICMHELKENAKMQCPMRSGRKRIEYHPGFLAEMSDEALEEALKTEALRILLKHPYQRRPDQCSMEASALGSNVTVADSYDFNRLNIESAADFGLQGGMPYEWYARRIQELLPPAPSDGDSGEEVEAGDGDSAESDKYTDMAELWDEDEMTVQQINHVISSSRNWGSLSGRFAQVLQASLKAQIDWRKIFSGFRSSVLSSARKLTRMRPNRRSGFDNMGSVRKFNTKLLVAVDVSGSVSDRDLQYFYGVINSAFRYGFEHVNVLQFDNGITDVQEIRHVVRNISLMGRGGTSFQEPVDYAHRMNYDGLVILTDGYAPEPVLPEGMRTKILWVCVNELCYEQHKDWMSRSGRVCTMQIM